VQGSVQELARTVSRKYPAGAIGAVRSRCETYNEQFRPGIAKARNRFTPVLVGKIGSAFDSADFFPVRNQSRASSAPNDFSRKDSEGFRPADGRGGSRTPTCRID